uniref:Uncharacterized protein n=1 Tax=Oryza brachyantha TaxID=4533 RepID=J3M348_ORYBR
MDGCIHSPMHEEEVALSSSSSNVNILLTLISSPKKRSVASIIYSCIEYSQIVVVAFLPCCLR